MNLLEKKVYLASRSPRRRELLKQIGVNFEVLLMRNYPLARADIDESPLASEKPGEYALRIARAKAESGWLRLLERRLPKLPILGADTTVAIDDDILGKPANQAEAEEMLRKLSGRQHHVYSAVAVAFEGSVEAMLSRTAVSFGDLSDPSIKNYVKTGEPLDKAGAYGVQGKAASFIAQIQGSYSGVMGLPLFETCELLRKFGLSVL